jgi:hypothetical protein
MGDTSHGESQGLLALQPSGQTSDWPGVLGNEVAPVWWTPVRLGVKLPRRYPNAEE